jgi:hypothetical protein
VVIAVHGCALGKWLAERRQLGGAWYSSRAVLAVPFLLVWCLALLTCARAESWETETERQDRTTEQCKRTAVQGWADWRQKSLDSLDARARFIFCCTINLYKLNLMVFSACSALQLVSLGVLYNIHSTFDTNSAQ